VLMGWVFDAVGSYETLLIVLAGSTLGAAALMQLLPRYPDRDATTWPRRHREHGGVLFEK